MGSSLTEKEHVLEWHLSNFSTLYHQSETIQKDNGRIEEVAPMKLRKPYPSSEILTTDFGPITARWKLRLDQIGGQPQPDGHDPVIWRFHLDLVSTHINLDEAKCELGPPGQITADITVSCKLLFLSPSGNETHYYIGIEKKTFGPNCASVILHWPVNPNMFEIDFDPHYTLDWCARQGTVDEIEKNLQKWVSKDEDVLRVRLIMKYINCTPTFPDKNVLVTNLSNDFVRILETGLSADFTIKCGESSFPVHKLILAARSPFFRAMFDAGMTEAASGVLTIQDSDPPVVKRLLEFIYSAKLELTNLEEHERIGLIAAADKYQLLDLKEFCFQFLLTKLSDETCGNLAVLVHLHNAAPWQKKMIFDYCSEHWKVLAAREDFAELVQKYPAAFVKQPTTVE